MPEICLLILDGMGIGENIEGNAVKNAEMPNLKRIWEISQTKLQASEGAVGLPEGQMGNSETGHLAIGAGRVVYQNLALINKEIQSGEFYEREAFKDFFKKIDKNVGRLHIMGLVSKGGVHSHMEHLKALLRLSKRNIDKSKIFVHAFTDGRDVASDSSISDIKELIDYMKENDCGEFASISGRYYAMDRDNRWERVKKCYDMLTGKTEISLKSPAVYMTESQNEGITDEFYLPVRFSKDYIKKGDSVIFFNFRPDRARELTRVIAEDDFSEFHRDFKIQNMLTMTEYDENFKNVNTIYKKETVKNTLSEVLSDNGIKHLKIAETEKYAHVTFFLNGGREEPFPLEERILIPSPKVLTYDLKPEMSVEEITEKLCRAIISKEYGVIVANFANPDMVGHTGNYEAVIKALEKVDECIGKVESAIKSAGGILLITSDHGNCEEMIGEHRTTHTTNKVAFSILGVNACLREGGLIDIAPTILDLLNVSRPMEMTGESLIGG